MTRSGFAVFDTAVGPCAIAWSASGIVGVQLPESNEAQTRRRMQRRFAACREAPPPDEVRPAIDGIVALLSGQASDLNQVAICLDGVADFDRRVYAMTRRIEPGQTMTYGAIATLLGDVSLARAVGQALGRNPLAIVVPCHRVLAANGKLGGFSASGGAVTKRRLLSIEGARTRGEPELFDDPPGG